MMRRQLMWVAVLLAVLLCSTSSGTWAFKIPTHRDLNLRAAAVSSVESRLIDELGVAGGLLEPLLKKEIREWIADGGAAEDQYLGNETLGALNRSIHHFQNPLLGWDVAGLDGRCGISLRGQASVRWSQAPDQEAQAGESASWADARRLFLSSLTSESNGEREKASASLFKTLGQQMHLIADLAAPAHVRNDIHCTPKAETFEVWAEGQDVRARLIRGMADGAVMRPDLAIFNIVLPTGESIAGVPVARLWDSDQYIKTNPDITVSPTIGLAEFTNANFFSRDTIFSAEFPFPARSSVTLRQNPEAEPKKGELRRYFRKGGDGAVVEHIAVPSALFEFTADALKDKKIGLDAKTFEDYGQLLFPRAVGYSAALLDYFFRGGLDVAIVPGVDAAGQVIQDQYRLTARNLSPEALANGQLTVMAEDAAGTRAPVEIIAPAPVAAGTVAVVGPVDPNGSELPSVDFRAPTGFVKQYVAVYQGGLGAEVKDPGRSFIGAVIGKVLPSGAAERISATGAQRFLTNHDGAFPYPAAVDGLAAVNWGDQTQAFAGVVSLDPARPLPDQVKAFQIRRPDGSAVVPLGADPERGQVVDTALLNSVHFPYDLDLGVQVNFSSTVNYSAQIVVFEKDTVASNGQVTGRAVSLIGTTSGIVTGGFSTRLTLNASRHVAVAAPGSGPYVWRVAAVDVDAQQRLLVLIEVTLQTDPSMLQRQEFPTLILGGNCNVVPFGPPTVVNAGFLPDIGAIWAVVDVGRGVVLGVSSEPVLSVVGRASVVDHRVQQKGTSQQDDGSTTLTCGNLTRGGTINPADPIEVVGTVGLGFSETFLDVAGQHRADLDRIVGTQLERFAGTSLSEVLVDFDPPSSTQYIIRLQQPGAGQLGYRTLLREGTRMVRGRQTEPEYLLRYGRPVGVQAEGEEGVLARWTPEVASRTRKAIDDELPLGMYQLQGASGQGALVLRLGPGGVGVEGATLFDFDRGTRREFNGAAAEALATQFRLLAPLQLYNTLDTHFHRPTSDLPETALPPALVGAPYSIPDPAAAYQVVLPR